jgi:cytochrome c55X
MHKYLYKLKPEYGLVFVFLILASGVSAMAQEQDIPASRQKELKHLLLQDCGSCHGMTLKGGLGPSLLPKTMSVRDPEVLRDIILDGVADTPMPPWRGLLTTTEVEWLVNLLQHGIHDK